MNILSQIEDELENVNEWKPVFLKYAKKLIKEDNLKLPKEHSYSLKIIKALAEMKEDMEKLIKLRGNKLNDYLDYMLEKIYNPEMKNKHSMDCEKWRRNPNINPKTGRKISPRGKVYSDIQKTCGEPIKIERIVLDKIDYFIVNTNYENRFVEPDELNDDMIPLDDILKEIPPYGIVYVCTRYEGKTIDGNLPTELMEVSGLIPYGLVFKVENLKSGFNFIETIEQVVAKYELMYGFSSSSVSKISLIKTNDYKIVTCSFSVESG